MDWKDDIKPNKYNTILEENVALKLNFEVTQQMAQKDLFAIKIPKIFDISDENLKIYSV